MGEVNTTEIRARHEKGERLSKGVVAIGQKSMLGVRAIVQSVNDVPTLCDEVDALRVALAAAEARATAANARTDRLARVVRAEMSFDEANDADPDTGAGHEILKDWDAIWQERDAAFAALLPGDPGEGGC